MIIKRSTIKKFKF